MKCTDKEWQHCQVEKMGCTGCYYDEIEVGEWIRNKEGYIDKVKKIINPDEYMKEKYYSCESTLASSYKSQIVKHSKNILDLITVGDVLKIKEDDLIGYIGLEEDELTYSEIKEGVKNKELKILKILTREQFEENSFEVI